MPQGSSSSIHDVDRSLLYLFRYLRDHRYDDDVGITTSDLRNKWPRFRTAVQRFEIQGFTSNNVTDLMRSVRELGGNHVAWSARMDVDGRGNLRVRQSP